MERLRRSQFASRMEMTPLMDVIFLLLTFFIYAFVMMMERPNVLDVNLPSLTAGTPENPQNVMGITLNAQGELFLNLNTEPTTKDKIIEQLKKSSEQGRQVTVYFAMEEKDGSVDRGPMIFELFSDLNAAGAKNIKVVGSPGSSTEQSPP